jgi:hypothetical protein
LDQVLRTAPENLAAIRGLAEIHRRRGNLPEALSYYRNALRLARHDPDLEQTVEDIARALEPARRSPEAPGGMTFAQASAEFLTASEPLPDAAPAPPPARAGTPATAASGAGDPTEPGALPALERFLDAIVAHRQHAGA